MKSLYEPATAEEIKMRIVSVTAETKRLWGKMDAAQVFAHCSAGLEMALGTRPTKRVFLGYVIGPLFKSIYSNEKPFPQSTPTAQELVVARECDLKCERDKLISLLDRFQNGGHEACTKNPHPFFGRMTPREWGIGMYKHLDHHLRQFGS